MRYLFGSIVLVVLAINVQAQSNAAKDGIIVSSSGKVVKGAPFSADAMSESVQIFADGNKISRSHATRLYRDSEGRFRREETSGSGASSSPVIFILDPVLGIRYFINPATKTARRTGAGASTAEKAVVNSVPLAGTSTNGKYPPLPAIPAVPVPPMPPLPQINDTKVLSGLSSQSAVKTESLGMRTFEGVEAEGTRAVTTIAAGAIGNERPFEVIYERWYSKELQLIVYSKYSDPRFGEHTYRLTNISRSEPDRSLFTVPSDYKIVGR